MIERDPNIVKSGLSRTVKKDGVMVEVSIIRFEHETKWSPCLARNAPNVCSPGLEPAMSPTK
jgi:hypothetical protein